MRGRACRMRLAIADTASCRASSRPAAAGISAISRAIAVGPTRSAPIMLAFAGSFGNGHPQVAVVAAQDVDGITRREAEAEKHGNLHGAVPLFDEAPRLRRRAANNPPHGPPATPLP